MPPSSDSRGEATPPTDLIRYPGGIRQPGSATGRGGAFAEHLPGASVGIRTSGSASSAWKRQIDIARAAALAR